MIVGVEAARPTGQRQDGGEARSLSGESPAVVDRGLQRWDAESIGAESRRSRGVSRKVTTRRQDPALRLRDRQVRSAPRVAARPPGERGAPAQMET